ncbi:AP-1 complex subunit gamma [Ascoidea rubescens DSM 1968]|uniref:AP-1 complex subunit gamma n=1 Tax=Ascoidea rubescens DSM 1968 TaxID=1344418 RepID=A0A1D2V9H2_9ASCO|nr:ARM repeat-containing protein [Ascoidea rubescens DSM 1968]ODV58103.1 ARM repeat-containing protein [Ascoidea rubescens DSM 1968]
MGSLKVFIKNVRYAKTIADERATIRKESAAIRTSFKNVNLSNNKRRENIAKLLYLYILGEKTHFGQIECIKLLASPNFIDKRLGYLATMLLLDENQEILTLLTNSLNMDLHHPNQFIVSLALSTVGNIASYDLSNDIYQDVLNILNINNYYLKKKAILVTSKLIEKNPDLIEIFYEKLPTITNINERNHSILLTSCQLIKTFYFFGDNDIKLDLYQNYLPKLIVILKNLSSFGYNPEYDVLGISDPFLQVSLLKTITLLITTPTSIISLLKIPNPDVFTTRNNDSFNDLLTQIGSNIEFGKNSANLILYEVVKCIFKLNSSTSTNSSLSLESNNNKNKNNKNKNKNTRTSNSLKILGINLLGKFLTLKDNNIKYISLNTLLTVVKLEPKTVQRHQAIIVNCLMDNDISIKRRALELIFEILNENNIRLLIKELIKFLESLIIDENGNNTSVSKNMNEFNSFTYNLSSNNINSFNINNSSFLNSLDSNSSNVASPSNQTSTSSSLNNLDLKFFITNKLMIILRNYSPNLKFFFKYLIIILNLNGNYITNDILSFILSVISNIANNKSVNIGTSNSIDFDSSSENNQLLIKDALNQIFNLSYENIYNNGLNLINIWCLGEFSELILNSSFTVKNKYLRNKNSSTIIDQSVILDYLNRIISDVDNSLIKSYLLTCLLKLSKTIDVSSLNELTDLFDHNININLQIKSIEFKELINIQDLSIKDGILERIPAPNINDIGLVSLSNTSDIDFSIGKNGQGKNKKDALSAGSATTTDNLLLDLMDDGTTTETQTQPIASNVDLLSDIFGSTPVSDTQEKVPSSNNNILDLFGNSSPISKPNNLNAFNLNSLDIKTQSFGIDPQTPANTKTGTNSALAILSNKSIKEIYSNDDIIMKLLSKNIGGGQANLEVYFINKPSSSSEISNINLLFAVAKSQKLVMGQINTLTIDVNEFLKQDLKVNGKVGSKLKLRIKFSYQIGGRTVNGMFDYNKGETL